eukprot:3343278-Amphidinium_carterae.1
MLTINHTLEEKVAIARLSVCLFDCTTMLLFVKYEPTLHAFDAVTLTDKLHDRKNTRIINNHGLEPNIGSHYFPSQYAIDAAPEEIQHSRDLFVE